MIEYTPEKAARFTKIISRLANKEEMKFCTLLAESGKPLWPVAVFETMRGDIFTISATTATFKAVSADLSLDSAEMSAVLSALRSIEKQIFNA